MCKSNELNKSNAPVLIVKFNLVKFWSLLALQICLKPNNSRCSSMIKPKVPTSSGMVWFQRFWRKAAGILGWIN